MLRITPTKIADGAPAVRRITPTKIADDVKPPVIRRITPVKISDGASCEGPSCRFESKPLPEDAFKLKPLSPLPDLSQSPPENPEDKIRKLQRKKQALQDAKLDLMAEEAPPSDPRYAALNEKIAAIQIEINEITNAMFTVIEEKMAAKAKSRGVSKARPKKESDEVLSEIKSLREENERLQSEIIDLEDTVLHLRRRIRQKNRYIRNIVPQENVICGEDQVLVKAHCRNKKRE